MLINHFDRDALRQQVRTSRPFPFFSIDNFLVADFAEQVAASFPSFRDAANQGKTFAAVNERHKIQITDKTKFPKPILALHDILSSPDWLDTMSYVMDIPELLADQTLAGGGIHETGPRGHLDVHIDFNYLEDQQLHRRLNILIYFNHDWNPEWGGNIELWDKDVKVCHHSFAPIFNRCVVFETNEISYHGVTAVKCPEHISRKSFAAYYYTKAAPAGWTGKAHSTIFKARPNERYKGLVAMPMEKIARPLKRLWRRLKAKVTRS